MSDQFIIGGQPAGGSTGSAGKEIIVVAARFNYMVTGALARACMDTLQKAGHDPDIYWVPGAFEIPVVCDRIFRTRNPAGIITLGAVIRGDTPHFDFVAGECAKGVSHVGLKYGKPVIFGVLTTDTVEQALNRAGLKSGNKGAEAASALLELLELFEQKGI